MQAQRQNSRGVSRSGNDTVRRYTREQLLAIRDRLQNSNRLSPPHNIPRYLRKNG